MFWLVGALGLVLTVTYLVRWIQVEQLIGLLNELVQSQLREERVMATLQEAVDAIKAEVAADRDVVSSAVTLLDRIFALLQDALANANPATAIADLQATITDLQAQRQALGEAVARDTPADPNPAPPSSI